MLRSTTYLNRLGDVTIVWTEEQDAMMLAIIEKKMAQGVVFFLVEPRMGGLAPPLKTELDKAEHAFRLRALAVHDKDFADMVEMAGVTTINAPEPAKRPTVKSKAKTAREVASGQSIAIQPMAGG
jgi:hypothetical protein